MIPIKAVLFDLDGTLLDTARDVGSALNHLLQEHQQPILPFHVIRSAAGSGCKGLLKLGMNIDTTDARYPGLCDELLNLYQRYLVNTTQLFPGMENILLFLENQHIPWGIVTNKPAKYTIQLVEHLKLHQRTSCIISGDSLPNRKPHPEPILHACQLLQQQPKDCLYIGDAEIDIQACKAAGSMALAALYGYIPTTEDPKSWGADGYIQHPREIMNWL